MLDRESEEGAIDFLAGLVKVVRTVKMYSPDHPAVLRELQQCLDLLVKVTGKHGPLSIGVSGGQLLLQEHPVRQAIGPADRFLQMLADKSVDSIVFQPGLTKSQLSALVHLVALPAEEAIENGQIKAPLLENLGGIRLNAVTYKVVRENETVVRSETGLAIPGSELSLGERLSSLFDEEFAAARTVAGGGGAASASGPITQAMERFFTRLSPHLGQFPSGESNEVVRQYFDRANDLLSRKAGLGMVEHAEKLRSVIASMPQSLQKSLFGKRFDEQKGPGLEEVLRSLDDSSKARLVLNEMRAKSLNPADLERKLGMLLEADEEIVDLVELVSQYVVREGGSDASKPLGLLYQMIQGGGETASPDAAERTVLIADVDETFVAETQGVLESAGFSTVVCTNGTQAYERIAELDPEFIVLDIKLPGMSGIEIISHLDAERRHVPLIVCSESVQFRDTFEVQMYPRLRFLRKPFQFRDFFDAVEELIGRQEVSEPSDVIESQEKEALEDDLCKARKIQARLLPDRIPAMPRFDASVYYNACRSVGGDYFDFIPIDEDHFGVVVADVSGKGVSGAMVMVMARSIFRSVAPQSLSPMETLSRVNHLLAADIRRGMFLTAYYMVVNLARSEVLLSCAGHNPAIVWDETMELCSLSESRGIALGLVSSESFDATLVEEKIPVRLGDRVFFYTDGVTECMNSAEEEFVEKRLIRTLNRVSRLTSQSVIRTLVEEMDDHRKDARQHDDITMLTFRRVG